MRSLVLALALAAFGLPCAAAATEADGPPRIYRWVDENGIAHYTTDPSRIPRSLRQRYGLPAEPLSRETLDPSAPAVVTPAPSVPDAWAGQEKSEAPPPTTRPPPATTATTPPASAAAVDAAPPELAAATGGAERLAQLELRIAELSAAIAADEDALAGFVGDPSQSDVIALGDTPQFREIAERLPQRLTELDALRAERDALLGEPAR
jgi:hypothetical protein